MAKKDTTKIEYESRGTQTSYQVEVREAVINLDDVSYVDQADKTLVMRANGRQFYLTEKSYTQLMEIF